MKKHQTTFRLDEKDREAIQQIREHYGVSSDIDAIRIALRELQRRIKSEASPSTQAPNKDSLTSP